MIEVLQFGLSSNRGGIETYLKKIWDNIDHSSFHFSFIDMTGEGGTPCFYNELTEDGCSFYKITPRKMSYINNRKDLKELFTNNHFDILHFNVNSLSYLAPVEYALQRGCKVLIHSRNSGVQYNSRVTTILHSVNKYRLHFMNVNRIAVSRMAGEWLFGSSQFDVYHNGIKTENYAFSPEARVAIRKELGSVEKTVIGSVAAFIPVKNHIFMVNAFEAYLRLNPDAVLWFIGDGPLKAEIEKLVNEKNLQNSIIFLGIRKDMKELYAGMDLLWLPSTCEGFGNVLLEAQCAGVPCLISDCIPQDARLLDNTFSYSLNQPLNKWAEKIQIAVQAQSSDRVNCWKKMNTLGVSVDNEIKRLENLYRSMVSED